MNNKQTKYLLIGFSVASWFAVRSIREKDPAGRILAVSEEEKAYSRPLISYSLGRVNQGIAYYGDVLHKADCDILWESRVVRLDSENRIAELDDGTEITFEKALVATGGMPVIPSIPGMNVQGVFTFTRSRDLEDIDRYTRKHTVKRAIVLGGGFIGLKTAEALMELDLDLSIIELSNRLLVHMIDDDGSGLLEKALRRHGVDVFLEDTVERFESDHGVVSAAVLRSGRRIPVSLAVVAIGVRPNAQWLAGSGINVNRGIVVDTYQETSVPGVYAAGDVAETVDFLTGEYTVTAIWPEAVAQGKIAGWNMAGRRIEYPGSLPVNAVEVGELPLISAGIVNPVGDSYQSLVYRRSEVYQKLVLRDDRVVGMVFIKEIEKAGIYLNLIRQRFSVEGFREKLFDPHFGIINLPSNLRKHMVEGAGIEV